ncbi:MAG: recombinase family protein [Alicyclobacillaceae bacterium]|nr:recombinase family protein [Alicyclobacillaceae bacterium]
MPRCAIYARVSDPSQADGESIEHQIGFVREYCRRRSAEGGDPWVCPNDLVFVDEGITGTSFVKRPAVQRLVQYAREGRYDVVLFKGISRFARDTVDALVMLRTLQACGVRVVSMEENFDSQRDRAEFIFTIHSALAQAESEKTAIRVRIGAMEKARHGRWNGRPPEGYRLNPETQRLEIDPASAATIRHIFECALSGDGTWTIAERLNAEGCRTRTGHLWTRKRVLEVLRNPVYAGDVVYGRRERRVVAAPEGDPLQRRRRAVPVRGQDPPVVCRDAHPPLVDRSLFEQVQRMLRPASVPRGRIGRNRLLAGGLARCLCGQHLLVRYNRAGTAYYVCSGRMNRGRFACTVPSLRADDLEPAVLHQVRLDVHRVLCALAAEDTRWTLVPSLPNAAAEAPDIRRQMAATWDRLEWLCERWSAGQVDDALFERMVARIQARLQQLQRVEQERKLVAVATPSDIACSDLWQCLERVLRARSLCESLAGRLAKAWIREVRVINIAANGDGSLVVELALDYRFRIPELPPSLQSGVSLQSGRS